MEHVPHFLLLADQQVAEGVHLHLVIAEVDRLDGAGGRSIAKQNQPRTILLAGRQVEVAEE
jgi:hypothetical protein